MARDLNDTFRKLAAATRDPPLASVEAQVMDVTTRPGDHDFLNLSPPILPRSLGIGTLAASLVVGVILGLAVTSQPEAGKMTELAVFTEAAPLLPSRLLGPR